MQFGCNTRSVRYTHRKHDPSEYVFALTFPKYDPRHEIPGNNQRINVSLFQILMAKYVTQTDPCYILHVLQYPTHISIS